MLLRLVPALLVASPVSLVGQDAPAVAPEPPRKAIPGFDIFKDGGELHDVMIPRYDASFRLLSVLKAKRITVVDESRLESDAVAIELYHPKTGGSRGRVDLEKAFLDQRSQILSSAGPVNFSSEKLSGNGHGLIHSIETGQTYFFGPTVTRFRNPPTTAMNTKPTLQTAMLAGISIMAAPAQAPAPATIEGQAAPEQEIRSTAPRGEFSEQLAASAAASRRMAEFLEAAARANPEHIQAEPGPIHEPADRPLDPEATDDQTTITSSNGWYLDSEAEEPIVVFLGDVKVANPQFSLSGVNELQIIFNKEQPNEPKEPAEDPVDDEQAAEDENQPAIGGAFGRIGDAKRLLATGAVRVKVVNEDGSVIEASGAILSYSVPEEVITLSGGWPWLTSQPADQATPPTTMFAQEANLSLRIDLKKGQAETEGGRWKGSAPIERKRQR